MAQVKKGDVVRLKSGGPKMSVESIGTAHMSGEAFAHCVWFEGPKKMESDFDPDVLEAAGESGGPAGTSTPRRGW